jgi:hypothetical protein
MILYKDWGKHIRLGNWLFIYSGLSAISYKTGNPMYLPENYFLWQYLKYPPEFDNNISVDETFHFRQTNYTKDEFNYLIDYFSLNRDRNININLGSHLQSEKFIESDIDYIKTIMQFKEEEVQKVRNKYSHILNKKTIGIGIRLGDFVNHGCFYQIPLEWYLKALQAEFKDWMDCNILFFSDDIEKLKTIFKRENYYFATPNNTHTHIDSFKHYHGNPMEQFILGTLCQGFVGGSSTFSWWQMWYIHNNGGKVVHSGQNLAGECLQKFYNPDYYPKNWKLFPC